MRQFHALMVSPATVGNSADDDGDDDGKVTMMIGWQSSWIWFWGGRSRLFVRTWIVDCKT